MCYLCCQYNLHYSCWNFLDFSTFGNWLEFLLRILYLFTYIFSYDRFHGCFDATVGQELESHRLTRCNQPVTSFFDNLEEAAAKDVLSFSEQAAVMNALSNDPTPQGRSCILFLLYVYHAHNTNNCGH